MIKAKVYIYKLFSIDLVVANVASVQAFIYCTFPKPFLAELCLTSNVKGQTVSSYSQHHFLYWYQMGHPSVICVSVCPKCV